MENEYHKYDMNLYRDSFQNYKVYQIPKAQLIIADVPYNLGTNAYGSNPSWYIDGDNKNGESDKAGKKEQQFQFIELAKKEGFKHYINLVFTKNFSAQVLKANMKIVGSAEYGLLLYRDKLPKFRNKGKMIFNCIEFERDTTTPKVHPTQKPVQLLKKLIDLFTDENDVVIDPCCGSGTTLLASQELGRKSYGFEVDRKFFTESCNKVLSTYEPDLFSSHKYNDLFINPSFIETK